MSAETSASRFDFSQIAGKYESWYETPIGRAFAAIEKRELEKTLRGMVTGTTNRLLEVGCGTGHFLKIFDKLGFRVFGVDLSREMLQEALRLEGGNHNLTRADGHYLPFPRGSFDVCCALTTLEFTRKPDRVLAQMIECTRPGGRVVVISLNRRSLMAFLRRRRGSSTFLDADLKSPSELRALLDAQGRARVFSTAFVLPFRGFLWLAGVLTALGRLLRLPFGDYLIGIVSIPMCKED